MPKGYPKNGTNKGWFKKGERSSLKTEFKKGVYNPHAFKKGHEPYKILENKNPNWKGDKVKYRALHQWVSRRLGKPMKCEHCKTLEAKMYDWANVSGEYLRDIEDWIRLCRSCHYKYDYGQNN